MGYRLAALFVVVAHLGFVAFVVGGGFLAWRWRRLLRLHVGAVVISASLAVTGVECPLSHLEKWLRRMGGEEPHREGFVAHYLVEPLLNTGISPQLHLGLRVFTIAAVVAAYAGVVIVRPQMASRRS